MIAKGLLSMFGQYGAAQSWSNIDPRDPNLAKLFGYGNKTKAGVQVNYETTLGYPAFKRGVEILSNGVKKIPLHVYEETEAGQKVDRMHPAEKLVSRKPHPWITADRFKQLLTHYALMRGNGLAYIHRANDGTPIDMTPLLPDRTGLVKMQNGQIADEFDSAGELYYYTHVGGEVRRLPASDVLHIMGLSPDGLWGHSVIDMLKESIGVGLGAREHGARFFGQGMASPGAIKVPKGLEDEEYERLERSIQKAGEGLGKAHRFMVLEEGTEIQELSMSHEDAQFLQTREFEIREVANIVGVQAAKLGDRKEQSYNSLEMSNQEHKDDDLMPWLCAWAHQCSDKLLTEDELDSGSYSIDFDDEHLEWVPYKERAEGVVKLYHGGLLNRTEGRKKINLPPSTDENRDEFLRPVNIMLDSDEHPGTASMPSTPSDNAAYADLLPRWESLVQESRENTMKRLRKMAIGKAKKGSSEFVQWLDELSDEQGPETIREHIKADITQFKAELNELIESTTASELLSAVEEFCSEKELAA